MELLGCELAVEVISMKISATDLNIQAGYLVIVSGGRAELLDVKGRKIAHWEFPGSIVRARLHFSGNHLAILWQERVTQHSVVAVVDCRKDTSQQWWRTHSKILDLSWASQTEQLCASVVHPNPLKSEVVFLSVSGIQQVVQRRGGVYYSHLHWVDGRLIAYETVPGGRKSLVRLTPLPLAFLTRTFKEDPSTAFDTLTPSTVVGVLMRARGRSRVNSSLNWEASDLFEASVSGGLLKASSWRCRFPEPVAVDRLCVSPDKRRVALSGVVRKTAGGLLLGPATRGAKFQTLVVAEDLYLIGWLDSETLIYRENYQAIKALNIRTGREEFLWRPS
ncbi:MAG: hypothetical protein CFK48_09685 [Armatimonadetes bacterium CP1_7O]|nr:MAG: hypothetical protein CFK48_09685 [Armatimonadetes bacterium CP1_7O]